MPDQPRVIFVDDEAKILTSIERGLRLRREPWVMDFIGKPEDALTLCQNATVDLAVLDLQMPGLNGIALAKEIRQTSPDTVCIMLTGTGDLDVAMEAVNDAGIFRFYTKPCDIDTLSRGISEGLATRAEKNGAAPTPDRVAAAAGRAALERLPIGVLVLDRSGKVIFTNAPGGAFLAARDGLSLSSEGICRASVPAETEALMQCISDAGAPDSDDRRESGLALSRPSSERPLSVIVTPIDREDGTSGQEPQVLLFVTDPDRQPSPSIEILQKLFQLTRSEANIVKGLAEGKSLDEIAPDAGITISSARTYLKQAFAKTGTNRQADLVRLVLTSPAAMQNAEATD